MSGEPVAKTLPEYDTAAASPGSNARPRAAHAVSASSRPAASRIERAAASPSAAAWATSRAKLATVRVGTCER